MGSFKTLKARDITVTSYVAKKEFIFVGPSITSNGIYVYPYDSGEPSGSD